MKPRSFVQMTSPGNLPNTARVQESRADREPRDLTPDGSERNNAALVLQGQPTVHSYDYRCYSASTTCNCQAIQLNAGTHISEMHGVLGVSRNEQRSALAMDRQPVNGCDVRVPDIVQANT